MIIVYAGSQADEPGRTVPRLPETADEELLTRLKGLLQSLQPSLLVGALASGADILFARAALSEGVPLKVVLPFGRDDFRKISVEPRGEPWEGHFDRIISDETVQVVEGVQDVEETVESFKAHNVTILDDAQAIAESEGERIWVVTVRPKPVERSPSVTDDLVYRAEARGHLTLDLTPVPQEVSGFIVMPYGRKRDARSGRYVDCDPVFNKIYRPLLEDVDITWSRADLETDSGIIHSGMIDALANSDLAIVDLATTNFNVAYELGVRHVFAAHSTVLVNPQVEEHSRYPPPFDINLIRVHSFTRGQVLTDQQAEDAIRTLKPVVEQAIKQGDTDSPAHDWFDLEHIVRPFAQRSVMSKSISSEIQARNRIKEAIRSSDADVMRSMAREIETASDLSESLRRALRIELAVALLDEAAYEDSRALLDLAQPGMDDPLHRLWLQKSVMVYRRLGEGETDFGVRQSHWRKARGLLEEAEDAGYADSETYGIWGGLIKRELQCQLESADPAVAKSLFREMAEKYRAGFELDPDFYTGVNLVMATRLSGRERDSSFAYDFNEALTVSQFLTRLAIADNPTDYWALITRAELTLHECLERSCSVDEAAELYAEAVRHGRPDQIGSTKFQLDFLAHYGDPADVIDRLKAVIDQSR